MKNKFRKIQKRANKYNKYIIDDIIWTYGRFKNIKINKIEYYYMNGYKLIFYPVINQWICFKDNKLIDYDKNYIKINRNTTNDKKLFVKYC